MFGVQSNIFINKMIKLFYILSILGFIWASVMVEIFFIKKSREKFIELKEAYKDFKKSKEDLEEFIK